jgi:hypothetical protein
MLEITICSVSYGCYEYLDLNWELTKTLNKETNIRWLIADNAIGSREKRMPVSDERFIIYEGEPKGQLNANSHHAQSLMMLLEHVNSRFVLVLDPDFYVIRKNWVEDMVNHMKHENLTFIGVPWHPSAYKKIRYFPSPHCLLIDLKNLEKADLNFLPGIEKREEDRRWKKLLRLYGHHVGVLERLKIGVRKDTGYRIKERFSGQQDIHFECLQAVFKPNRGALSNFIDHFMPDCLSFRPKKRGYTTDAAFSEIGLPFDPYGKGCEEFMWQGKPFGFHVRRYPKRKRGNYGKVSDIKFIRSIMNKL